MKNILKVIYICFGVIFAFLAYVISFNTYTSEHIIDLATKALDTTKPEQSVKDICRIFTSSVYGTLDEVIDTDCVKGGVAQTATVNQYSIYEKKDDKNEVSKTVIELDNCYVLILYGFNNFGTQNCDGNSNELGLKFINDNDEFYTYHLNASSTINSKEFVEYPQNNADALLCTSRDTTTYITNFGFTPVLLSQSLINEIKTKLNLDQTANFKSVELIDNLGNTKYTFQMKFDYNGEYFTNLNDVKTAYNNYAKVANDANVKTEDKDAAQKLYEDANTKFQESIRKEGSNFVLMYDESVIRPSSIIWKSVGIVVLLAVCLIIIYVLLFYFRKIRDLVLNRGSKHTNPGVKNVQVKKQAPEKKKDLNEVKIIDIPSTKKEEKPVEETSTEEVVEPKEAPANEEAVEPKEETATEAPVEEVKNDEASTEEKE